VTWTTTTDADCVTKRAGRVWQCRDLANPLAIMGKARAAAEPSFPETTT
jgi:hypothetical protein